MVDAQSAAGVHHLVGSGRERHRAAELAAEFLPAGVLNVVCGVAKISMDEIVKGVWPFMIAQLIVLFLMILFPALVTVPAKWFTG